MSNSGSTATFMDAVLAGDALHQDIDEWIDAWHESPAEDTTELHDYLGMTWEEYRLFVERPESLRFALAARRTHQPLALVLSSVKAAGAAARSDEAGQAERVLNWLVETGRVEQVPRAYP
jgi:hypothetical protein